MYVCMYVCIRSHWLLAPVCTYVCMYQITLASSSCMYVCMYVCMRVCFMYCSHTSSKYFLAGLASLDESDLVFVLVVLLSTYVRTLQVNKYQKDSTLIRISKRL